MADISQVKLPNGDTYNLVDETSGYIKRFLITIDFDDSTNSYSADKTFAEITNAYNDGYELVCHCIVDNSYVPFLAWNNSRIQFELSAMTQEGVLAAEYIKITNTNEVEHQFMYFDEMDPVFNASAAAGITSGDITNWNNKTSNTGTITSVKTTAGAHTIINVSSGAANFNVPTKTSHLTNDSGYLTLSTLPIYDGTVE